MIIFEYLCCRGKKICERLRGELMLGTLCRQLTRSYRCRQELDGSTRIDLVNALL